MHPTSPLVRFSARAFALALLGLSLSLALGPGSGLAQVESDPIAQQAALASTAPAPTATPGVQPLWWTGNMESIFSQNDPRSKRAQPRVSTRRANGDFVYEAVFEEDLFLQTDLVLPGIHTAQSITFPSPRLWQLLPGSEIRLALDHSSALLPDRSHLTVSVNGSSVKSIALTADNVIDGELVVPLPLHLLKDYNTLTMEVHQHYTDECEDPFSSSLWTKVSRRSSFRLVYRPRDVEPNLLDYPLPLFDAQGYGPTILNYVLPRSPSPRTLEALGVVSAGLGRDISYHPMALGMPVSSVAEAPGNAIVVGTPSENPEVAALVGNRVRDLAPGQGLVALIPHPGRKHSAVLVVSGSDPAGVLLAAKALTSERRHEVLSGQSSVVTQLIEVERSVARERERFVPNEEMFPLEHLGQGDVTVRGFFAPPISVPVRALPDLAFVDGKQRLKVYYGYGAQLHTRLSTLEVRWNNITLKSIPLDNPVGEERAEAEVAIPAQVISPYNTLEFVFHLIPRAYEPCEPKVDRHLTGTIYQDTMFYMPRYHWAEMPDLGKLQYAMYPLGIYQDLSETLLVTPDSPDTNDLMATVAVAGELGRATAADRVALRTVTGGAVSEADRRNNHMVLLASGNSNSEVEALGSRRPLALTDSRKNLNRDDTLVLQAIDPSAHGTLEEMISPYGSEKAIIILQGLTPEYLISAIRLLSDPSLSSQLSGNVSLLGMDRNIRTVQIGDQGSFGAVPVRVRAADFGRNNLLIVLLCLIVFFGLAYLVLTFIMGRYRREQFGDDDDDDDFDPDGGPGGSSPRRPPPGPGPVDVDPRHGEHAGLHQAELEALRVEPQVVEEQEVVTTTRRVVPADRPPRRPPPRRPAPMSGDDDEDDGDGGRSRQ